jgi:hypothetical protein
VSHPCIIVLVIGEIKLYSQNKCVVKHSINSQVGSHNPSRFTQSKLHKLHKIMLCTVEIVTQDDYTMNLIYMSSNDGAF